jgi:hypothetical protein
MLNHAQAVIIATPTAAATAIEMALTFIIITFPAQEEEEEEEEEEAAAICTLYPGNSRG